MEVIQSHSGSRYIIRNIKSRYIIKIYIICAFWDIWNSLSQTLPIHPSTPKRALASETTPPVHRGPPSVFDHHGSIAKQLTALTATSATRLRARWRTVETRPLHEDHHLHGLQRRHLLDRVGLDVEPVVVHPLHKAMLARREGQPGVGGVDSRRVHVRRQIPKIENGTWQICRSEESVEVLQKRSNVLQSV